MNTSTLMLVFLIMAALLTTLTWVGLRFFCPSPGPEVRAKTASRWRLPRYRWPSFRGVFNFSSIRAHLTSKHALWLGLSLLLMASTVALILFFSGYINPPDMTGEDMGPTDSVRDILTEEVLVPPQPLPPEMFIGTESFDLEHADRDWSKLDAGFRNKVLHLFARMENRGYQMALLEGYRSAERQDMLATKGKNVTQAKGGQSKHQYGLAADVAPVKDGRLVISERDAWAASAYKILGEEAGKLGLVWGGNWAMRDLGHVERAAKISSLTIPPAS